MLKRLRHFNLTDPVHAHAWNCDRLDWQWTREKMSMIDKSVGFAWLVEMIKDGVKYALGVQKRTLEAGVQLLQQYCRNETFCLVCGGSGSFSLILYSAKSRSLRQSSLSWILFRRKFCAACRRPVIVHVSHSSVVLYYEKKSSSM